MWFVSWWKTVDIYLRFCAGLNCLVVAIKMSSSDVHFLNMMLDTLLLCHFVPRTLRTFGTLHTVTKLVTSYCGQGTKWLSSVSLCTVSRVISQSSEHKAQNNHKRCWNPDSVRGMKCLVRRYEVFKVCFVPCKGQSDKGTKCPDTFKHYILHFESISDKAVSPPDMILI